MSVNVLVLLKSIHMAGKEEGSCFSVVQKLAEADDEMRDHPAFGFKASLVQVLGNLCWKHRHNQDSVCIDNNPLIVQVSTMFENKERE